MILFTKLEVVILYCHVGLRDRIIAKRSGVIALLCAYTVPHVSRVEHRTEVVQIVFTAMVSGQAL